MGKQEANDGYRIGSGPEHFHEVFTLDSADGNERNFAYDLPDKTQPIQTDNRVRVLFRLGLKDWADGYVVNRQARGPSSLFDIVRGEADDGTLTQKPTRSHRRKIVLAQMNAIGRKSVCDVNAVVDDETHTACARDAQSLFRFPVKLTRRVMLLA